MRPFLPEQGGFGIAFVHLFTDLQHSVQHFAAREAHMGDNDGIDAFSMRDREGKPVPYTFEEKAIAHPVRDIMTAAVVAKSHMVTHEKRAASYTEERADQIVRWGFGFVWSLLLSVVWLFVMPALAGVVYLMGWWVVVPWFAAVIIAFLGLGVVNLIRFQHSGEYMASKPEDLFVGAADETLRQLFKAHALFWLFPLTVPAAGAMLVLRFTSPKRLVIDRATVQHERVSKDARVQSALMLKEHIRVMNALAMLLRTEERIRGGAGARVLGKRKINPDLIRAQLESHRQKAIDHVDFIASVADHGELGSFHGDLGSMIADSLESIREGTALLGDEDAQRRMQLEVLQLQMLGG